MNHKLFVYKRRLALLCVMLLVVLLTTGVSYALFTSTTSQEDENSLAASCMDMEFTGKNEINLTNAYPITENEAEALTPYTFTITNKCDNYIEYYVIASVIRTTNKVDSKYVKVSLLGDSDLNGTVISTLGSMSTPQSLSKYNITENYILKRGDGITKDESRTFNFRMWLDSNNPDIWTSEDVEGKDYQVKISVVGTVKTRPKDDLFIAALVDGEESTSFPTTSGYTASVECTRNGKKIDVNESIKWNGTKWVLTTSVTEGNVRCNAIFGKIYPKLKETILANNEVKTPLTTPGSEVSAHVLDDITDTSTASVSSTYQAYYYTYGTSWEANGTKFNLTNASVTDDTYANSYSTLIGKYLAGKYLSDARSSTKTKVTTTGLDSIFYIVSATSDSITYKQITSNKNMTEAVLASTEDDYGTSYYFRGAVKNNYVQFANKCWRIVRITGDGSVKLVLHNDNTSEVINPCASANNSTDAAFARYFGSTYTTKFNSSYEDNAYIGFMYGSSNIGCENHPEITNKYTCERNNYTWKGSASYAEAHANTNKSTILTNLETWYENNLASYESKLADTIWCNDKSTVSGDLGYGANTTYYGVYNRLFSTKQPTLKCPNDNNGGKLSKFTVNDTINGNGDLTYKIGLLTADEAAFAGTVKYTYNYSTYLQENTSDKLWYTLSPSMNSIVSTVGSGYLGGPYLNLSESLRPAISLVSDITIFGGTGTSEDPYVVK